jgi:hypothetical protein
VAVRSGARQALTGTTGGRSPAVSRTGRLAYIVGTPDGTDEIRLTSLSGGTSTRLGIHDRLWDLEWDPSGRWLAATGGPYESPQHTYVYDTSAKPALVRTMSGGSAVTWLDTASAAPAATLVAPAWTRTSASLSVGASDLDDAVGGLRRECRLDAAKVWTACGSTWSLTGLAAGRHTASARVTDPSGHTSTVAARSWTVDATTPTATLRSVPSALTAATTTLSWTATDSGSGPASYDVRQLSASISGRLGAYGYPASWQGLRTRTLAPRLTPGSQYCWSVRARDVAGNVGAWSAERCTSVALDDRALTGSSGWTRGTSTSYAYGTWSRARRSGISLTRTSVQGRRVAVLADTCPTCGALDVFHAGRKLGRVSLYSAKAAHRQVRWLPLQPSSRTGSVVLRSTSSRAVYVDGVVVVH